MRGMALPISKFPHCRCYLVRNGRYSWGWGTLPGDLREPLQVSSIKAPGLHQPVREESTEEAIGTKSKS